MHVAAARRRLDRRARARRASTTRCARHRPPHLQRLHEGLHLPEAGAGQHPADRDGRAHRRARHAAGASRSTACSRAGTRSTCERPYALPYNGKNVLVVGLGPAGYTLAHHLAQRGLRRASAIDGLKIEPLPAELIGADDCAAARRSRDCGRARTARSTSARCSGFGGVTEYGITVRWDKNFLTRPPPARSRAGRPFRDLRRRPLRRHARRSTTRSALGFDHVAIAAGAGQPTIIDDEEQPDPRHPQGVATS